MKKAYFSHFTIWINALVYPLPHFTDFHPFHCLLFTQSSNSHSQIFASVNCALRRHQQSKSTKSGRPAIQQDERNDHEVVEFNRRHFLSRHYIGEISSHHCLRAMYFRSLLVWNVWDSTCQVFHLIQIVCKKDS